MILLFISSFQFYPVKSFSERSIHARFPPLIFSSVEVTPGNTNVCLNIGLPIPEKPIFLHEKIGVTGFDPATSTSRTQREESHIGHFISIQMLQEPLFMQVSEHTPGKRRWLWLLIAEYFCWNIVGTEMHTTIYWLKIYILSLIYASIKLINCFAVSICSTVSDFTAR